MRQGCGSYSKMILVGTTLDLGEQMRIYPQVLTSLIKPFGYLAISRCCFADYGKEMDTSEKRTCRACMAVN